MTDNQIPSDDQRRFLVLNYLQELQTSSDIPDDQSKLEAYEFIDSIAHDPSLNNNHKASNQYESANYYEEQYDASGRQALHEKMAQMYLRNVLYPKWYAENGKIASINLARCVNDVSNKQHLRITEEDKAQVRNSCLPRKNRTKSKNDDRESTLFQKKLEERVEILNAKNNNESSNALDVGLSCDRNSRMSKSNDSTYLDKKFKNELGHCPEQQETKPTNKYSSVLNNDAEEIHQHKFRDNWHNRETNGRFSWSNNGEISHAYNRKLPFKSHASHQTDMMRPIGRSAYDESKNNEISGTKKNPFQTALEYNHVRYSFYFESYYNLKSLFK